MTDYPHAPATYTGLIVAELNEDGSFSLWTAEDGSINAEVCNILDPWMAQEIERLWNTHYAKTISPTSA